MLVNGKSADTIAVADRGLSYGDGVFRTLRIHQGSPFCWQRQFEKLKHDCDLLQISCPAPEILQNELGQVSDGQNGIAKIIVTRGIGERGYAADAQHIPTRIVSFHQAPEYDEKYSVEGIALHLCEMKLSRQPRLAGIKHLNRLENVLAASECRAAGAVEGLLEDTEGYVVSGTRSNLFAFSGGGLLTPDLSESGVAGVQRDRVTAWAEQMGIRCEVRRFDIAELLDAEEIFLVNSVFGLWPVASLQGMNFRRRRIAMALQAWLNDENN